MMIDLPIVTIRNDHGRQDLVQVEMICHDGFLRVRDSDGDIFDVDPAYVVND